MIGSKVCVYITRRFHERVLRKDPNGLYIKLKDVSVSVRPDTNTLNVIYFVASEPKKTISVVLRDSEEVISIKPQQSYEQVELEIQDKHIVKQEVMDQLEVTTIYLYRYDFDDSKNTFKWDLIRLVSNTILTATIQV